MRTYQGIFLFIIAVLFTVKNIWIDLTDLMITKCLVIKLRYHPAILWTLFIFVLYCLQVIGGTSTLEGAVAACLLKFGDKEGKIKNQKHKFSLMKMRI